MTEKPPSLRNAARQQCYLTSVIATSAAKHIQMDAASATPTAGTATNSRNASANGMAANAERVPRLCIAPSPKAS